MLCSPSARRQQRVLQLNKVIHKLSKVVVHFHKALRAVFLVSLLCGSCCGGTNELAAQGIPFSMAPVRLRDEPSPKPARAEQALSSQAVSTLPAGNISLDIALSDTDLHSRVVRGDRFYLTQAKALPDSGADGFVHSIFTPEVFQIGKASVSCPIATAFKRKNPLCLLSGLGTDRGLLTYVLLELSW